MSRDKQIEEMRNIMEMDCDRPCAGCELEKDDHFFTHIYATRIYNAGYRKQSEWISVDERLPEREGKYLVCTTNGNIGVGNFIDYYGKGTHLCFDCWAVTHWMPLPEPPRKEDEGK